MAKSTTFSNDLILLIFNGTNISLIADNTVTSPLTNLYLALHTSDPGVGGAQTTNETSYTNYVRIAVARTGGGWSVASGAASNVAAATFATCGASGATITHVSIGTLVSGAGKVLYAGVLNSPLVVVNGVIPSFAGGALTATES
jgi:hypothetical protein